MNAKLSDEAAWITGSHEENPTLGLPCRVVFSTDQRQVELVGLLLEDEATEQHKGVWG